MFLLDLIILVLWGYEIILLGRVLMSWIPIDTSNPTVGQIVQFMYDVTEPVLAPVRNALPQGMGIDFSPLIVFIGLQIFMNLLRGLF